MDFDELEWRDQQQRVLELRRSNYDKSVKELQVRMIDECHPNVVTDHYGIHTYFPGFIQYQNGKCEQIKGTTLTYTGALKFILMSGKAEFRPLGDVSEITVMTCSPPVKQINN